MVVVSRQQEKDKGHRQQACSIRQVAGCKMQEEEGSRQLATGRKGGDGRHQAVDNRKQVAGRRQCTDAFGCITAAVCSRQQQEDAGRRHGTQAAGSRKKTRDIGSMTADSL